MCRIIIAILVLIVSVNAKDKPNIIFILLDDMGYSDMGSFGGEVATPNMDYLAKKGLRFTQNYNSARCCPSRASLLTGLYSHQAGIADFTLKRSQAAKKGPAYLNHLNKTSVTLAEVLKTAGYNTYGVGKWHVGDKVNPIDRGFDEYYGYLGGHSQHQWDRTVNKRYPLTRKKELNYDGKEYYATDVFNDYAVEFIKQGQKKEEPFFLYLAHSSPHFPLHAPAKTRDKYIETYMKGWDTLRKERYERQKKSGLVTDSWSFTELSQVPNDRKDIANGFPKQQNPAWKDVDQDRQRDLAYRMATFAAMIEHVDTGLGRVLKELKESGELDNTLIFLTSDNGACYEWGPYGFDKTSRRGINILHKGDDLKKIGGEGTYHSVGSAWSCLSNTPLRMYKHFNHEGGNCSPLLAFWPKGIKKADRWVRTPTHLIDIMPTICEVSGAQYPKEFNGQTITPTEGVSFLPLFNGSENLAPRSLFFDHFESSAIRSGDWKLVRGNKRYNNRTWELYNIAQDRCETKNLINDKPEIVEELKKKWLDWAKRVKVFPYYKH